MRGAPKAQPVSALAVALQANPMLQANRNHHRATSSAVPDNTMTGLRAWNDCTLARRAPNYYIPQPGLPPTRAHMSNALCRWEAVKAWMPDMYGMWITRGCSMW